MRALLATGIAVALAVLAGGAQARDVFVYRGPCGEVVLPSGPTRLRATVRVDTSCGRFAIGARGVRFVGSPRKSVSYVGLVGGRSGWLNFYERGRVRWRSDRRHQWGAGVSDSRSLAFLSSRGRLYITDLAGPERAVGVRFESPLGWTRAGLLLTGQNHVLRVRTRSGRLVRILERRAGSRSFDQRSRTLVYAARDGAVVRTDGQSTQRFASRVNRWTEIVPLEADRVALVGRRRVVVLDSDGSILTSDRRHYNVPAISSHGAIAMISTGPLDGHSRARESVRLLRPGDRSSKVLFATQVGALGCGHWPTLAWRSEELLYATSEGHVVVITPGSGENLDLTRVVSRLPGEFLEARWA